MSYAFSPFALAALAFAAPALVHAGPDSGATKSATTEAAATRRMALRPAGLEREHNLQAMRRQLLSVLPSSTRLAASSMRARQFGIDPTQPAFLEGLRAAEQRAFMPRVALSDYLELSPVHRRALTKIALAKAQGEEMPAFCFAPDTAPAVVEAFNAVVFPETPQFQQNNRWSATATNGNNTGGQGGQITLTYSFVADGTQIPDGGFGAGPSTLQANLRTIYGTDAVWQQIYHDMFAGWGALCGMTYVFEPNDDGVTVGSAAGVLGVRGDLRMSGKGLDGNGGVLAYNNFPQNGDMVVDSIDSFYTNTSGDSRRLRNVLFHEHGHGAGFNHVCPSNQTKLMEPFISTAYFGPQFDDILNAQRHYGDNLEPNDSYTNATVINDADTNFRTIRTVSIDDNSDVDIYSVAFTGPARLVITVRPFGVNYIQGPQTQACNTGTDFSPTTVNDLNIQIVAADRITVLASASGNGAGAAETASVGLAGPGSVFVRVNGGTADSIQAYELDYRVRLGLVEFTFPSGLPTSLVPGQSITFPVDVQVTGDTLSVLPTVSVRGSSAGAFTSINLVQTGTSAGLINYTATLPGFLCGSTPQFFFATAGLSTGLVESPSDAPAGFYSANVGNPPATVFSDNAETNQGWTFGAPGDGATTGIWTRGDPTGTTSGAAVQPEDDNDAVGTQCFFTGQGAAGAAVGSADVDGGATTLLSPVFSLAGSSSATVSFARWYSNFRGGAPNADTFRVDISNDGGINWVNARTVGPAGAGTDGGWIDDSFDVLALRSPTANMRLRFIAEDLGTGSLVEAAIDSVVVTSVTCVNPPSCAADFNGDSELNPDDLADFIGAFFAVPPPTTADFNSDGDVNPDDLADFIGAFFAGCP